MNLKKIGVIVVWAILTVVLLYFLAAKKSTKGNLNQERIFKDSLVISRQHPANIPGLIQEKNDKLYFISWEDANIIEFDKKNWEVIRRYGSKGNGPTENINISSFDVRDSSYITYDQGKKSIQEVSFNDSLLYFQQLTEPFFNSIIVGDNILLSGQDNSDKFKKKFTSYDITTSSLKEVLVEIPEMKEEYSELIYHGIFVKNENYEVYVTLYNNAFFVFDKNLSFEYKSEMIYDVKRPAFKYVNGNLVPDRGNVDANQYAHLDENNLLYIISNITADSDKNDASEFAIVDVYDITKDEYMYSFKIPDRNGYKARELVRKGDKLYVLYLYAIVEYEIN